MVTKKKYRADKIGQHRTTFEKHKRWMVKTERVCAICGGELNPDKYKFPHPLSTSIDHIIPISLGGGPSSRDNLQATHLDCNRKKADKILMTQRDDSAKKEVISNRILPHTFNWSEYKAK